MLIACVERRNGKVDISMYKNKDTHVRFTCHAGHEWLSNPGNVLNGSTWCPICRESQGENEIRCILKTSILPFLPQYTLKPTRLEADFFIESKNLIIEFDGYQHFSQEWHGKKDPKIRTNDLKKNAWCVEHKIHLLRIPWWTKDVEKTILDAIADLSSDKLLTPPEDYYGLVPPEITD